MAQIQDLLVGIDENTATSTGVTAATATRRCIHHFLRVLVEWH